MVALAIGYFFRRLVNWPCGPKLWLTSQLFSAFDWHRSFSPDRYFLTSDRYFLTQGLASSYGPIHVSV